MFHPGVELMRTRTREGPATRTRVRHSHWEYLLRGRSRCWTKGNIIVGTYIKIRRHFISPYLKLRRIGGFRCFGTAAAGTQQSRRASG